MFLIQRNGKEGLEYEACGINTICFVSFPSVMKLSYNVSSGRETQEPEPACLSKGSVRKPLLSEELEQA